MCYCLEAICSASIDLYYYSVSIVTECLHGGHAYIHSYISELLLFFVSGLDYPSSLVKLNSLNNVLQNS